MSIDVFEHFALFLVLTLLVCLVYSGLRQDEVKAIIRLGLKRFAVFLGASLVLAVGAYFFALWL